MATTTPLPAASPSALITIGAPCGLHIIFCGGDIGEARIGCGRNIVVAADVLGETLGAFQPRRRLARPECLDPGGFQLVDHAGAERAFRADHDKVHLVGAAEGDQRRVIADVQIDDLGFLRDAGIAGRAIEPLHQRARRHLPGQRMFAPAGAEKEDVHLRPHSSCPGSTRASILMQKDGLPGQARQ